MGIGDWGTKLQVKINCKDLMAYEWSLYEKIKVFCGKNVCSGGDKNDPDVTYDFWLNAMKKGFSLWRLKKDENNNLSEEEEQLSEEEIKYENLKITWDRNNRYGACLGFFLTIFNNKDECPVINETKEGDTEEKITRICGHSQNIQISYGGGFINKDTNSSCGVSAVENVLYSFVNSEKANVFKHMTDYLVLQGYEKGFSLAAIPNDFRKFINTNTFVHDALKYHVDRMYELTGKPVIIIAHSFGNLVTLDALTKEAINGNFTKKIKKWISLAAPFAGANKAIDYFLNGMEDFNKKLSWWKGYLWFERFGQKIMLKAIPTIYELKPFSIFSELFESDKYKEFAEAIRERILLEKNCRDYDCKMEDIEQNSTLFNKYFKDYFPSLTLDRCKYESSVGGNQTALNKKCMLELFNIVDCPGAVKITPNNFESTVYNIDDYCKKEGNNIYYSIDCDKKDNKNCLDDLLTEVPYFYDKYTEERKYLMDRFNDDYSKRFGKIIDENYFESQETIIKTIKEMTKHQKEISIIKDLPIPPVDIDLVFATFNPTLAAEFIDKDLNMLPKDQGGPVFKGGDGTVPSWSPILTGLKWIYEKETENLTQNIRLVNYCSRLGEVETNLPPNFLALQCQCLNSPQNVYLNNLDDCAHQGMLNDDYLMLYIKHIMYESNETIFEGYNETQVKAVKNYDKKKTDYDFVGECNHKLASLISPDIKQKCVDISITKNEYDNHYCYNQGFDVISKDYECCSIHISGINDKSEQFEDYECVHLKPKKSYIEYFKDLYKTNVKFSLGYDVKSIDVDCKTISIDKSSYLEITKILFELMLLLLI